MKTPSHSTLLSAFCATNRLLFAPSMPLTGYRNSLRLTSLRSFYWLIFNGSWAKIERQIRRATDRQTFSQAAVPALAPASATATAWAPAECVTCLLLPGVRCVCSILWWWPRSTVSWTERVMVFVAAAVAALQVCTRYSSNDEVFLLCLLACVLMNQTGNIHSRMAKGRWCLGERSMGSLNSITGQFPQ